MAIEEVSTTEPIIVGKTVDGSALSEVGIEVVSIEEECRKLIFEVGKDDEERSGWLLNFGKN